MACTAEGACPTGRAMCVLYLRIHATAAADGRKVWPMCSHIATPDVWWCNILVRAVSGRQRPRQRTCHCSLIARRFWAGASTPDYWQVITTRTISNHSNQAGGCCYTARADMHSCCGMFIECIRLRSQKGSACSAYAHRRQIWWCMAHAHGARNSCAVHRVTHARTIPYTCLARSDDERCSGSSAVPCARTKLPTQWHYPHWFASCCALTVMMILNCSSCGDAMRCDAIDRLMHSVADAAPSNAPPPALIGPKPSQ